MRATTIPTPLETCERTAGSWNLKTTEIIAVYITSSHGAEEVRYDTVCALTTDSIRRGTGSEVTAQVLQCSSLRILQVEVISPLCNRSRSKSGKVEVWKVESVGFANAGGGRADREVSVPL